VLAKLTSIFKRKSEMKINNKTSALAELWARLTASTPAEAKYRVRAFREAGLLPDCRATHLPLTETEIAMFILGATVSDSPLHAAERAKAFGQLRPTAESIVNNPLGKELAGLVLVDALAAILRHVRNGGLQIAVTLTVSTSHETASLIVGDADEATVLCYGSHQGAAGVWRLERDVTVHGEIIGRMASLLEKNA
jgi:hypothetical protein